MENKLSGDFTVEVGGKKIGTGLEVFYGSKEEISKPRLKIPVDNGYLYISATEENLKKIDDENINIPYHWFAKYLEV